MKNVLELTNKQPGFKMATITTPKFLKNFMFLSLPVLYPKDLKGGIKTFIIKQNPMDQRENSTYATNRYTTFVGG